MKAAVADGNNIVEFMQSTGYIAFQPDAASSSKDLYAAYKLWCEDNAYNALSMKSFCNFLGQNARTYHIAPHQQHLHRQRQALQRFYRLASADTAFLKIDIDPKSPVQCVQAYTAVLMYAMYASFAASGRFFGGNVDGVI